MARLRSARAAVDAARASGQMTLMLIYKILRADEWAQLETDGQTQGAPIDVADGFVHFSTAAQAQATADLHFAGVEGLVLAAVDTYALGDALRWEPSRGGDLFPHLFALLKRSDVVWCKPMPLVGGKHKMPDAMV